MKVTQVKASVDFDILQSSRSSQATVMVLQPGDSTGEMMNEHPWSEQWLFVISGSGSVRTPTRRLKLRKNSLVLIEKRERHQVVNTGRRPMVSLNLYVPPAYDSSGEPAPPKSQRSKTRRKPS
jgi:mannose-6-phosphate isomerase-like protein (cupin superfamily)